MRYYEYLEPQDGTDEPLYVRRSELDIVQEYGTYWLTRMYEGQQKKALPINIQKIKMTDLIQTIIDDWIVVHWASEVFPDKNVPQPTPNFVEEFPPIFPIADED